jgi:regulator of CtrA degradation
MQHPAFVRKTYDETLSLMVQARDYAAYGAGSDCMPGPDASGRLALSCEAMRITARLASVMAWLMRQRAIHNGELQEADVLADGAWLPTDPAGPDPTEGAAPLPFELNRLRDHSRRLYERVARIEALLLEKNDAISGR